MNPKYEGCEGGKSVRGCGGRRVSVLEEWCLEKKGNKMMRLTEPSPRAESEGQKLKCVLRELRSWSLSGLISHQ